MKAAVLTGQEQPLEIEDLVLAAPGPGEVEVQIVASGVCHSDLHAIQHPSAAQPPPVVLGHEGAGIVSTVGAGVTSVKVGDHVILAWQPKCGECYYCLRGMPWACTPETPPTLHLSRRGGQPVHSLAILGTFAERTVVPRGNVVKIREDASLQSACLVGCGVMTGVGAVLNTAKVEAGASVVVIGTGGVGLNVIQGARLAAAGRIIAVDLLDNKLEFAREFGATHTINASRENVAEQVRALTGGRGADYGFEVIGTARTIAQAFEVTRKAGTTIAIGGATSPETWDFHLNQMSGKTFIHCQYGSARPQVDFPILMDLYMDGRLKVDELITRRYPLDDVNEAFRALKAGEVARSVLNIN